MTARKKPAKAAKTTKRGTSRASAADRRRLFVEAMLTNGGNKRQAAIAAGYKEGRAADKAAERMSHDVAVIRELEARRAEVLEVAQQNTGMTVERILREVARLAMFDVRKLYDEAGNLKPVHLLDDDTAAAIASVEVDEIKVEGVYIGNTKKLKVFDKNSALEKAMKHLGQYDLDNEQKRPSGAQIGVLSVALDFDKVRARSRTAMSA